MVASYMISNAQSNSNTCIYLLQSLNIYMYLVAFTLRQFILISWKSGSTPWKYSDKCYYYQAPNVTTTKHQQQQLVSNILAQIISRDSNAHCSHISFSGWTDLGPRITACYSFCANIHVRITGAAFLQAFK